MAKWWRVAITAAYYLLTILSFITAVAGGVTIVLNNTPCLIHPNQKHYYNLGISVPVLAMLSLLPIAHCFTFEFINNDGKPHAPRSFLAMHFQRVTSIIAPITSFVNAVLILTAYGIFSAENTINPWCTTLREGAYDNAVQNNKSALNAGIVLVIMSLLQGAMLVLAYLYGKFVEKRSIGPFYLTNSAMYNSMHDQEDGAALAENSVSHAYMAGAHRMEYFGKEFH